MFRDRAVFVGCAAALFFGSLAQAEYIPISLTGWTDDVIVEKEATSPVSATSTYIYDTANMWVLYETGANSASKTGLPTGGSFTSNYNSSVTFQLQSYSSNNTALVSAGAHTTLTLAKPSAFSSLAFLVSSTYGGGAWYATLNYSDGTSENLSSVTEASWVTASSYDALTLPAVVKRSSSFSYFTCNVYLYEHDWTLTAAEQQKTVASVTITVTSGQIELFALSGETVPEPSATMMMLTGAPAGLFAYVSRKRRRSHLQ